MNNVEKGGESASKDRSRCHCEKKERERFPLVYVKYLDHVLFRDIRPLEMNLAVREAVGWIIHQNHERLLITAERSCKPLPYEKSDTRFGLLIVRSCILEIREIRNSVSDRLTSGFHIVVNTQK